MKKKLSAVGNSYGLVIEKPILELLNIDKETDLEVTTDGLRLIIEPIRTARQKLKSSAEKIMKKHDSTFKKLASKSEQKNLIKKAAKGIIQEQSTVLKKLSK